jgi:hypothetical protein
MRRPHPATSPFGIAAAIVSFGWVISARRGPLKKGDLTALIADAIEGAVRRLAEGLATVEQRFDDICRHHSASLHIAGADGRIYAAA